MAVPAATKFSRKGVTLENNVERVNYTLRELTRAALKDTGKYVCRETRKQIKRRTGRLAKNTQYWVRSKDADLQVGFKPGGFYGGFQELGTRFTPKIGALRGSVEDNIGKIREIQAQYLSAISTDDATSKIDESEEMGDGI